MTSATCWSAPPPARQRPASPPAPSAAARWRGSASPSTPPPARETGARAAAGAVCRRLLEEFDVAVHSHTVSIGDVCAAVDGEPDWAAVEESPVRGADAEASKRMVRAIDAAREAGDTLGGAFEMRATGVPIGLGSHVMWDRKLDGLLAQAVMSIHAVKGVEIGGGFALTSTPGSLAHDIILPPEKWDGRPWRRATNRAGGLEGGITNGARAGGLAEELGGAPWGGTPPQLRGVRQDHRSAGEGVTLGDAGAAHRRRRRL